MTTPSHTDLHRDFGKMEAGLEALKEVVREGFQETNDRLHKVETRLASLEQSEHRRAGIIGAGKWVWGILTAAGAAIGGAWLSHFWGN